MWLVTNGKDRVKTRRRNHWIEGKHDFQSAEDITTHVVQIKHFFKSHISSIFSRDSEANASEFLESIEDIFSVWSIINYWNVISNNEGQCSDHINEHFKFRTKLCFVSMYLHGFVWTNREETASKCNTYNETKETFNPRISNKPNDAH